MSELINRIALVTGASRGIGKAIALALANAGAGVAVNYHEHAEEAASVVDAIHRAGGRAVAIGADVSIAASVQSMISTVEERLGPIDVLVNNAGIAPMRGLEDITEADFDRSIAVNLKSAPGLIDTEMGKPLIEAGVGARIPVGRVGTGDEIAQAVLLLVRDAFITGQMLAVNGGSLFS